MKQVLSVASVIAEGQETHLVFPKVTPLGNLAIGTTPTFWLTDTRTLPLSRTMPTPITPT